jgi:hypothetical protein
MSDAEWDRLKATFQKGGREMPAIVKRAEGDRRREIIGFVGFYAIIASLVGPAVAGLWHARTAIQIASAAQTLLLSGAMVIVAHVAMRGTLGAAEGTPLALLDALEWRHAGRRRLARALPWLTGACLAGTIALAAARMIAAGHFDPGAAAITAVVCLATAALLGVTLDRLGKKIDRDLREVAEARKLLADDGAR